MAAVTATSLVDLLRQLRLLEPAQVDEVAALQARFPEPKALAGELVRRGWLTPFQINQLLQGRGNDLLLGSYVLLERLGEGGMGQVFKARHQKMGRVVALKLIRKDRLTNPDTVRRFENEIRAAAQLNHPNVVTAHDAAQVGDTHFFVMEYVEGTDLDRLVRETGPLPLEQACAYIRQAASGLQHAQEKGIVHRDIKPSNLLLSLKEGQVKVLDMGLARMLSGPDADDTALTKEDALMGTPDYEAPEQARQSRQVDIRTDLYSLGCTFYFLLTGRPPFPGGTIGEKLIKHQLEEPEPVEKLNPEVPPEVAKIVRRLMAKRPEDRFQTPAELAAALESLRDPESVTQSGSVMQTLRTPGGAVRGHRRLAVGVAAGLAAVLLVWWLAASRAPRIHPVLGYALNKHPANATELNGHWFAFYPEKMPSWNDAQLRCRELGGYLACVRSPEEQQLVLKLSAGQNTWLGGTCDGKAKWFWITGEPITTFYWCPGQPNNGPNSFLQIFAKEWHDIGSREQKAYSAGYVCQWDN